MTELTTKAEIKEAYKTNNDLSIEQIGEIVGGHFSSHERTSFYKNAEEAKESILRSIIEICDNDYLPARETIKLGDVLCLNYISHDHIMSPGKLNVWPRWAVVEEIDFDNAIIKCHVGNTGKYYCDMNTGEEKKGIKYGYLTGWNDPLIPSDQKEQLKQDGEEYSGIFFK